MAEVEAGLRALEKNNFTQQVIVATVVNVVTVGLRALQKNNFTQQVRQAVLPRPPSPRLAGNITVPPGGSPGQGPGGGSTKPQCSL